MGEDDFYDLFRHLPLDTLLSPRLVMPRKAAVKYRSLRSNLVHLPLSLYASLAQSQTVSRSVALLTAATPRLDPAPCAASPRVVVSSRTTGSIPRMEWTSSCELPLRNRRESS